MVLYLQNLINFCCQIIKVLHCDQLSLHKPQLTIALRNCLPCCMLAMQQIHRKLSWQVDLHNGKGFSDHFLPFTVDEMDCRTSAYHSSSPACEVDSFCHLSLQVLSGNILAPVDSV